MKITKEMIRKLKERTDAGLLDCRRALEAADGDLQKALEILKEKGLALFEKRKGRQTGHTRIFVSFDNKNNRAGVLLVNSETDFASNNQDFIDTFQNILDKATTQGEKVISNEHDERISLLGSQLTEHLSIKEYYLYEGTSNDYFIGYLHKGHSLGLVQFNASNLETFTNKALLEDLKKIAVHVVGATPQYLSIESVSKEAYKALHDEIVKNIDQSKPAAIQEKMIEGQINKRLKENALLTQPFAFDEKKSVQDYVSSLNTQHNTLITIKQFILFDKE